MILYIASPHKGFDYNWVSFEFQRQVYPDQNVSPFPMIALLFTIDGSFMPSKYPTDLNGIFIRSLLHVN